jgi:hypothetical protein
MVLYQTVLNVYGHTHATEVLEVGGDATLRVPNGKIIRNFLSQNFMSAK